MATERVQNIDEGLRKYYQSLGETYDKLFYNFCHTNEYTDDEENLVEELDADPQDSMLLEAFDINTFPFNDTYTNKNEDSKREFIADLLKKCDQNNKIQFSQGQQTNDDDNNLSSEINIKSKDDEKVTKPEAEPNQDEKKALTQDNEYQKYIQNNPIVKKICNQLNQRYKEKNIAYDRMFSLKCKDQELDDESVQV